MSDSIIEIRNLSRRFGAREALQDVTLEVPRGGVFGLVGENGAGKTTLIKHILGLLKARAGSVRVFGLDPAADPPGVLGRIGYLSEERDLPDWMRVSELMNYTRAFYPQWDDAYAEELLATFGLDPKQRIKTLSRGQRAQAGLLIALAHRPELLLLDEPSSGLDPIVRRDILSAIIRTVADEGRTVVFSSHILEEVERTADRVAMIHAGRLVMCDEMDTIKSTYRRVVLRFEAEQHHRPELPGALSVEGSGREWTVICNGRLAELMEAAAARQARIVEESAPTLDEIFIARAKG